MKGLLVYRSYNHPVCIPMECESSDDFLVQSIEYISNWDMDVIAESFDDLYAYTKEYMGGEFDDLNFVLIDPSLPEQDKRILEVIKEFIGGR